MIPSPLRVQLTKEFRALLVPWLACAVAAVAGTRFDISGAAAGLGCLLLGAWSIGHEYSLGTLPMLLAQPVSRHRVLLVKLAVLTLMLVALVGVWMGTVRGLDYLHAYYGIEVFQPSVSALRLVGSRDSLLGAAVVVAVSVSLAPWLTIVARNSLAGVIFTCAVAIFSVLAAGLAAVHAPGTITSRADVFSKAIADGVVWRPALLWPLLSLCAVGAVLGLQAFSRLEAIDGHQEDVHVPGLGRMGTAASARTTVLTRQSPFWLQVKKELRLQQLTFIAAALFLIIWSVVLTAQWLAPTYLGPSLAAMAQLYGGVIALLAGSLSSAEERQLGTVEWQALLPVAARRQWAIKIGTAIGVTVLLAIVLPDFLALFDVDPIRHVTFVQVFVPSVAIGIVMVCVAIASSYVSSLCRNGLQALVITVPVVAGVVLVAAFLGISAGSGVFRLMVLQFGDVSVTGFGPGMLRSLVMVSQFTQSLLFVSPWPLLLYFSFVNYRSLDRSPKLIGSQIIRIIACVTLLASLRVGLFLFETAGFRYNITHHVSK